MRKPALIAMFCVFSVAATALVSVPAEAQQQRKRYARSPDQTVIVTRDESGRTRTRVVVNPRSYLDGGTEVLPGQRKFNFMDAQPYWSPIDVLGPGKNYDRQPLNPRWEQGWTRMWN